MLWHPVVGDVVRAGCIRCGGVEMKWQECSHGGIHCVRWVGLLKCQALIGKSTDAAIASKVMIERPIFLNQDHDVFNVSQFGANRRHRRRSDRTTVASMQTQRRQFCNGCCRTESKQFSASKILHRRILDAPAGAKVALAIKFVRYCKKGPTKRKAAPSSGGMPET